MRAVLLGLALVGGFAPAGGLEIVGYDGKEQVARKHHKKAHSSHKKSHSKNHSKSIKKHAHFKAPQHKMAGHPHAHHFHHLINEGHSEQRAPHPALDLMKKIAHTVVPKTHHPALAEIVKVAQELVVSKDEDLADATIATFHESLMKLSEIAREDPPATGAIADMRADVCGSKPDMHKADCEEFMKAYCSANEGKESCANFFHTEEEDKEDDKDDAKEEGKDEPQAQQKKDDGPPPEKIPEQGFDGKPVAHVDGETATDDWRHEFGPGQGDTYESVCAKHPNNDWCVANGYAPLFHSGAVNTMSSWLVSVLAVGVVSLAASF